MKKKPPRVRMLANCRCGAPPVELCGTFNERTNRFTVDVGVLPVECTRCGRGKPSGIRFEVANPTDKTLGVSMHGSGYAR